MKDLRVPEKKFRPELEGIRAVATFLVAVYHIWLGSVSGGVDVFFIVSGYLITTSLLSRLVREGRINFFEHILGLGKRLFPLFFTVLLFTASMSVLVLPRAQWEQIISEFFASAFYFENWQLATSAVDYLAQNNQASPFQHIWALSIQGQFYVTWPFVILISYLLATKVFKTPVRKTLLSVLASLFTISIGYSIYITAVNQPWAYFDTFARVWEFSLGGILALLLPYLKLNKTVSLFAGWFGLAVISLTGILLPVSTVFPGYAALLPIMGVTLVILSAENRNPFGVQKLLGSKPFLYFGGMSYGFYLWHWPLLIFYYAYFNTDTVRVLDGLAIILTAFILSVLSVKFLETPIRNLNIKQAKPKVATALLALMVPALSVGAIWETYFNQVQADFEEEYLVKDYPGARVLSENITPNPDVDPLSKVVQAKSELPHFYSQGKCYTGIEETKVSMCSFGVTDNPDYIVALVDGSHAGHWFPALEELSEDLNIQIDVYNKDACRFSVDNFDGKLSESCMNWNAEVIDPLTKNPPDLIFTNANVGDDATVPAGYIGQWEKLEGVTDILAVRDNPWMKKDIPLCVEDVPGECSRPREKALSDVPPWENTENIPSNVTFADLSDYFCGSESCRPIIGNVIVYRDSHHITNLYSKSLAPALREHLSKALKQTGKQWSSNP